MKITIISTAYPLRGGIAHYVALLADALKGQHDVNVVTFKRQYPAFLFPGKSQEEGSVVGGVDTAPQLVDSINPLNWLAIGRMMHKARPDLIVFKYWLPFFGPCFGTIAWLARRNGKTRVLTICDNVIPHERRPGDRVFTKFLFRFTDAFIVQSRIVEKDLLSLAPTARYRLVPHPTYSSFGEPLRSEDARRALGITEQRVLLFFGYIRRYKGLQVLLEALSLVPTNQSLRLLVVGEYYDDASVYQEQIDRLGLSGRISIVSNYVPNDEVRVYFSAADVVVLPYLSATQSGIAQIAFHFEKPMIVTEVGGLAESVHDRVHGLVVPPQDPQTLAAAITQIFEEGRIYEYAANVRRDKHLFSWGGFVKAIEELTER